MKKQWGSLFFTLNLCNVSLQESNVSRTCGYADLFVVGHVDASCNGCSCLIGCRFSCETSWSGCAAAFDVVLASLGEIFAVCLRKIATDMYL